MRCSVVIPTYRRLAELSRCLEALVVQRMDPREFEIIVADNAGDRATRDVVRAVGERSPVPVRWVDASATRGPAAARNAGSRVARGGYLAFTDDDTIPLPEWVARGCAALDDGLVAAAGTIRVPLGPAPTRHAREIGRLEQAAFVTANCFCRREALERLGGFDERYTEAWREDSDLHFRLLEAGLPVGRAAGAIVLHPVRAEPWGVSLRLERKHRFDALLYREHPELFERYIGHERPVLHYAIVLAIAAALAAGALRRDEARRMAMRAWGALTLALVARRLHGTALTPSHVSDVVVTSTVLPVLSVFWRLAGAARHGVPFW
jgi:GT2 family glycosyltransferase